MSRSVKDGGLPPDDVVQDPDTILADCERVIARWHDPRPGAAVRMALAPCSPFSVDPDLMRGTAELARRHGVRLHTHLAETRDENDYCLQIYGCRPLDFLESVGWLGPDVWLAHGIWFDDAEIARLGARRDRHRPLPVVEHAAGLGHLPRARPARAPAARSAWRSTARPATTARTCWPSCGRRCCCTACSAAPRR